MFLNYELVIASEAQPSNILTFLPRWTKSVFFAMTLILSFNPLSVFADELEDRIERLEQTVNNRQQFDLINRLNELQMQVEMLHGEMEVQKQNLQQLTDRQHLLFQDLDNRLVFLEKGEKPKTTTTAPATTQTNPVTTTSSAAIPAQTTTADVNAPLAAPAGAATISTPPAIINPQQDQAAYQQAYQFLLDKQYPQATDAFNNYLRDYPQGRYRPNAYYWLGEVFLIRNQPNEAQKAFNTVITDYPQNTKVADAMLKLGFSYAQMGEVTQAKIILTEVTKKYPNTAIAGLAQSKLSELP